MQYSGKYGEYRVLTRLLEMDIEAYQAIKTNQDDYDITAILPNLRVVRIQVKTRVLNNRSTNNSIDGVDRSYDYLIVVIIDTNETASFYVMTKVEAMTEKGSSKQLSIKCQQNGQFCVKNTIAAYKDRWEKISLV